MNKKDILNKIKALDGLNQDERAYLVNLVNTKKKYGLVWEDKPEDVEEQLRTKLPVLQEVKERAIINDTEEQQNPNHILIEGDNLHALTALTFTHENKIDLIYIDPPYNTGKKDFIYNDHYVDKEDAYRHSKWISFMEKRLRIAHKLLKDDGVIFISIDENECHNLKVLLDEIFGENNFVEQIIWNKRIPKNDKGIGNIHESILLYAKKYSSKHSFSQKKDGIEDVNEFVKTLKRKKLKIEEAEKEIRKFYKRNDYDRGITLYNSFDSDYKLWGKINVSWPNAKTTGPRYDVLHPKTLKPTKVPDRGWRFTQETFESMLDYNNIIERHDGSFVCGKVWFAKDENTQPSTIKYLEEVNSFLLRSIISTKSDGSNELLEILGQNKFDYPKPTDLINRLLDSVESKDLLVLDFFAGSGTTLHTLINLNDDDNGSRQGILVTNNENNIAEEVTYERNKRVIQGYTNAKGEQVEGLKNNNLRYYKTAFVDREPSLQNKRQLTQLATELLCIKEDCYTEVQHQLSMNPKQAQIFTNNKGKYLVAIYHSRNQLQVQEQLITWVESLTHTTEKVRLYAFSPEKEVLAEEFYEVAEKVEVVPLPEAIYNAYLSTIKALKLDKKQVYNTHTAEA